MIGTTVLGNDGWHSHRILISSRQSEVPFGKLDSWSFLGFCLLACFVCLFLKRLAKLSRLVLDSLCSPGRL